MDADSNARDDPIPWYAKLHELGPVSALDASRNHCAAVVNGYDADDEVLHDPRRR